MTIAELAVAADVLRIETLLDRMIGASPKGRDAEN
jgi:hypothetical protein